MNKPDYNSASSLKAFLEENGMAMQKKFGQNFMLNADARSHIVDTLNIKPGDFVWEIGPGLGCMTEEILKRGANLTVFEIDRKFILFLHEFFKEYEEKGVFKIVEGDVLKNWKKELESSGRKASEIKLFGNLPYNIAATFVADTITENKVFSLCTFTVQKEVAERMASENKSENYSAFSVLCHSVYNVKLDMVLAAGNFWPRPNVASQVVLFIPVELKRNLSNYKDFVKLVHALFSSRRKTIFNNIKSVLPKNISPEEFFVLANVDGKKRAEDLTVEDFFVLSDCLTSAILKKV